MKIMFSRRAIICHGEAFEGVAATLPTLLWIAFGLP
jgi:hypothetical protein